jgi:hypothetical protein
LSEGRQKLGDVGNWIKLRRVLKEITLADK